MAQPAAAAPLPEETAPAPAPYAAPFGHLTTQQKVFTLLGSLLGLLLGALDQTVVATAGPAIQRDLHVDPSLYVWITTAYLVSSTVLVPIYGKLSDLFGRRTILLAGISIFLLGSLLCGVSASTFQLIVFRAIQGAGSAALFTTAFAVVADLFTPVERGKYQGIFGAVFAFSSVAGPLVGGFITDTWGWHWVFFINLPVGAVALALIATRMPALRRPNQHPRIDVAGAVALTAGVVPLLLALSLGKAEGASRPGYPWLSWQIAALLAVALVSLTAFVVIERRVEEPILDFGLFNSRPFRLGVVATFFAGASFLAALFFLPLFMVNVVGLSATRSGLTTMPLTMGIVFANILVGQVVSRIGKYKGILVGSMVLSILAFAVMGFTLTAHSTQAEVTLKMILMGLGLGPSMPLLTLALQSAAPGHRIGVATSTSTFSRQMGSTIGLAFVGTIFATVIAAGMQRELAAVIQSAPPEMRARMDASAQGHGAGMGAMGFDAAAARERIARTFAEQRQRAGAAMPEAMRAQLDGAEQAALRSVDRMSEASKLASTGAIRRVYQWCIPLALLAFLACLIAPEVPLRGARKPPAVVE